MCKSMALNSPVSEAPCAGRRRYGAAARGRGSWLLIEMLGFFAVAGSVQTAMAQPGQPELYAAIKTDHSGSAIAFSRDGKTLAVTSGRTDAITLWDVATKKILGEFEPGDYAYSRLVYAPDGKSLALMSKFSVSIFEPVGRTSRVFCRSENYPEDGICSIAYAPDGKLLATGDSRGRVKLWDIANRKVVASMAGEGRINDLAFLPDGKAIVGAAGPDTVAAPERNGIWIWDVTGKRNPRLLNGYKYPAQLLAISPDGKTIVSPPGDANEVWLWDVEKARIRDKWKVDFKMIDAIAFSQDGRILVAAGGNGNLPGLRLNPGRVTIWDTKTGKKLSTFNAIEESVGKAALSPDGKLVAVSATISLMKVNVWDISRVLPKEDQPNK